MDAPQWLATVFTPTLNRESLAYSNDADLLRGQLAALHDCGVLDDQAHADAQRRLDAAVEAARHRAQLEIRPAGAAAIATVTGNAGSQTAAGRRGRKPAGDLRRVLAVARPLANIDGMPFILTSVELWTNRIDMFLAGVPTAETEKHIRQHEDEINEWARKRRAGLSGEGALSAPQPRGSRLLEVDIRLRDDLGTSYLAMGGSAGGGHTWRVHRHYEPGVPERATTLTVEVASDDGATVGAVEVPL